MNLQDATQIAEEYLSRLTTDELQVVLFPHKTIERDFGWVFSWGPSDESILVAGNAPFIVDRKDGSVHVTGTSFPIEQYLESYDLVRRTYPFAAPEHIVILEGWKPGLLKVSLTKLIHTKAANGLAEAKRCTDDLLAGKPVALIFSTAQGADEFCADAQLLGVPSRQETRYK